MRKRLHVILAGAAVLCLIIAVILWVREYRAGKEYEALQEAAKTAAQEEAEEPQTEEEQTEESGEAQEPAPEIPIDFASLQESCPDIYAWITIPGTAVDYPIVQRPGDNAYYLTHDTDGNESAAGAIFTEDYNSMDFMDPNTVIYGHNMKNGTMFRSLHEYRDRSFFDEHRDVTVYLPAKILHYEIFAAYLYDSRHLLQSFDFSDPDVFAAYLDSIQSIRDMNAFVDTDVEVTAEDRIITLSTCYKGMSDKRYLVQAVLVSIEE